MDPRVRALLRGASFEVHPARFAIVGVPASQSSTVVPLGPWSAALQAGDEVTFYLPEADWDRAAARFPGAEVQRGWRLLTLRADVPWDLAGVLAELTGALGRARVPCAALSAYRTDHLLVPGDRLPEALAALDALRR